MAYGFRMLPACIIRRRAAGSYFHCAGVVRVKTPGAFWQIPLDAGLTILLVFRQDATREIRNFVEDTWGRAEQLGT